MNEDRCNELLEQLAEMTSCIRWKRKVLEQAKGRAKKKLKCLVKEMEVEGEDITAMVIDASVLEAELFRVAPASGTVAAGSGSSQGS